MWDYYGDEDPNLVYGCFGEPDDDENEDTDED